MHRSTQILLVDDDSALLDVLSLSFGDAGYDVRRASDGVAALESVLHSPPALIVSDVNMPRLDGFALCRKLREARIGIPVVLLTSRDGEIDEVLGLELGADDYIAKPFSTRILLARVAALLRRDEIRSAAAVERTNDGGQRALHEGMQDLVKARELVMDVDRLVVHYRGAPVTLTLTEFRLLEALVRRKGIVLSRDRLLDIVRGDDSVVAERIVDTYVRRLRRKFQAIAADFSDIETMIGAGYRWRD